MPISDSRPVPEVRIHAGQSWTPHSLATLWASRELTYLLARRDVLLRYQHSVVGIGWAVLQPLVTLLVLTIFQTVIGQRSDREIPYPLYAMTGLVPWTFFVHAITLCSHSILKYSSVVNKVHFPRLVLPLATLAAAAADFVVALPLIPLLMLYYGIFPRPSMLFVPLVVLHLALFTAAVGIWMATLNTRFRDTANALPFLTQLWFFLTPIAYHADLIPSRWQWLAGLNPMLGILEAFRWTLFGIAHPMLGIWVACSLAITAILLVSGVFVFLRQEETLAEVL